MGLSTAKVAMFRAAGNLQPETFHCQVIKALSADVQGLDAIKVLSLGGWAFGTAADLPSTLNPRLLDLGHAALSSSSFGAMSSMAYLEWHAAHNIATLPCTVAVLDLSSSGGMTALPVLDKLTKLQLVDLSWCDNLKALPELLGALTGLQQLKLTGCRSLKQLPESLGALTGLQHLDVSQCASLAALPNTMGALRGLCQLDLSYCTSLAMLPWSLGALTGLQQLDLSECSQLGALPQSLWALTGLRQLDLKGCISLAALPKLPLSLKELRVGRCRSLTAVPAGLTMVRLTVLLPRLSACTLLIQLGSLSGFCMCRGAWKWLMRTTARCWKTCPGCMGCSTCGLSMCLAART